MQEVARNNGAVKKAIGNWAKAQAVKHNEEVRKGKSKDKQSFGYKMARKIVLR